MRSGPARVAAAAAVVAAGAWLVGVRPAAANTEKSVKLDVGQQVTFNYSDLVGDDAGGNADTTAGNPSYSSTTFGQDPADCQSLPSCDDIPLVLNVPQSALAKDNNLLIRASVSYDQGPSPETPGGQSQPTNQIQAYLWENPIPTKGENANSYDTQCANYTAGAAEDPCILTLAAPTTAKWDIVVDQLSGFANSFRITISLTDVGSAPPSPSGSPAGPATAGSGLNESASGSPAPGPALPPYSPPPPGSGLSQANEPSSSAIGIPVPQFGVASGGADPRLEALAALDVSSSLGAGNIKAIQSGQYSGPPPAEPASPLAVILAFVTTPVLLGLGWVALARRRRALVA